MDNNLNVKKPILNCRLSTYIITVSFTLVFDVLIFGAFVLLLGSNKLLAYAIIALYDITLFANISTASRLVNRWWLRFAVYILQLVPLVTFLIIYS